MKKIIKRLTVYFTIVMVLCCSFVAPVSAASADVPFSPYKANDNQVYYRFQWLDSPNNYARIYMLPVGEYSIDCLFDLSSVANLGLVGFSPVCWYDVTNQVFVEVDTLSLAHFVVTEDMLNSNFGVSDRCLLVVNSTGYAPSVYPYRFADDTTTGVYYQAFDLLSRFIYGQNANLTSDQTLVLTFLATTGVLLVIVVPFLLVFWTFRLFR